MTSLKRTADEPRQPLALAQIVRAAALDSVRLTRNQLLEVSAALEREAKLHASLRDVCNGLIGRCNDWERWTGGDNADVHEAAEHWDVTRPQALYLRLVQQLFGEERFQRELAVVQTLQKL